MFPPSKMSVSGLIAVAAGYGSYRATKTLDERARKIDAAGAKVLLALVPDLAALAGEGEVEGKGQGKGQAKGQGEGESLESFEDTLDAMGRRLMDNYESRRSRMLAIESRLEYMSAAVEEGRATTAIGLAMAQGKARRRWPF